MTSIQALTKRITSEVLTAFSPSLSYQFFLWWQQLSSFCKLRCTHSPIVSGFATFSRNALLSASVYNLVEFLHGLKETFGSLAGEESSKNKLD